MQLDPIACFILLLTIHDHKTLKCEQLKYLHFQQAPLS